MIYSVLQCVKIYNVYHAHALQSSLIVLTVLWKVELKYVRRYHPNILLYALIVNARNAIPWAHANYLKILHVKMSQNPSLKKKKNPSLKKKNPSLKKKKNPSLKKKKNPSLSNN